MERAQWPAWFYYIYQTPTPPKKPPTLPQAVRWIAQLGDCLGRKHDGNPGVTVMWRSFQRLSDIVTLFGLSLMILSIGIFEQND